MYSLDVLCGCNVEIIEVKLIEHSILSLLWHAIPYLHNEYVNINKRMLELLLLRVLYLSDYLDIKSAKEWAFL